MSDKVLTPDICVIGAGSGGLSVAAAAAAFGVPVVLIEKGKMGGDCLNYGCVPSKSLIAAARQAHLMHHAATFGIENVEPGIDFRKVNRHIHDVIAAIAPNDAVERFTALGVQVIKAEARFKDGRTVVAGETEIRARRFVLATGSSPKIPPIPGLETVDYLTNETIFDLRRRPGHLVIIGGGAIGIELAQAYSRLGSQVTVLEAREKMLGGEDPELAAFISKQLRKEGVALHEGVRITGVERHGRAGIRVRLAASDGRPIDGTHLLVATGRSGNVHGLGLDNAGVGFDAHGVKVDTRLRTTNRRVYAIGDAAGGPQFTHVANYHAKLVVKQVLFRLPARADRQILPRVVFTDPELAYVGMTESEARKTDERVSILRWPYSENDRAQAERRTEGEIKVIVGKHGRILGAGIVGASAGEMINLWALAIAKGMRMSDVAGYVAPYPTLAEIGKRAAISYFVPATRSVLMRRLIRFLRMFG